MLHIKTTLTLLTIALLIISSCGKRKVPLPPVEKIRQEIKISGIQQGNTIILNGTLPKRNASKNNVQNISRVDIYRLVEKLDSPVSLTEEEFASQSTLIDGVDVAQNVLDNNEFIYRDSLVFSDQPVRIRYAVRYVNASGQKAGFSNFLLIEPVNTIASAPELVSVETAQNFITLQWNKPTTNIDGTNAANILGYNIYRSSSGNSAKKINTNLVKNNKFDDQQFAFENSYEYFIRAVTLGRNGEPIESLNSNTLNIKPIDTFAPSAPTAITIAASPGLISIFFAFNPEPDVKGYFIYRTTQPDISKEKWEKVNNEILVNNTFQDTATESGKTYYYYLIAQDKYGNNSQPSDVVSETSP